MLALELFISAVQSLVPLLVFIILPYISVEYIPSEDALHPPGCLTGRGRRFFIRTLREGAEQRLSVVPSPLLSRQRRHL